MTVVASGRTSVAAFLYPAKASIAMWSMPDLNSSGWLLSQSPKASAERPGTMSMSRAGRDVRSTMTVTHRSMPRWDQQCSSTPIVDTPSSREPAAEVEDGCAHGVPRRGEVLRDHVDAHLIDDHGLQCPVACGARELRPSDTRLVHGLGPALPTPRAPVGADSDGQSHCAQPDRGMDEFADPGGPDESALLNLFQAFNHHS